MHSFLCIGNPEIYLCIMHSKYPFIQLFIYAFIACDVLADGRHNVSTSNSYGQFGSSKIASHLVPSEWYLQPSGMDAFTKVDLLIIFLTRAGRQESCLWLIITYTGKIHCILQNKGFGIAINTKCKLV